MSTTTTVAPTASAYTASPFSSGDPVRTFMWAALIGSVALAPGYWKAVGIIPFGFLFLNWGITGD